MDIFKFVTKAQVLGVVRHVITVAAGVAITNGYLDSETAVQLTGWLTAGAAVLWSILSKNPKEPKEQGP